MHIRKMQSRVANRYREDYAGRKRMKKGFGLIIIIGLLAAGLSACGGSGSGGGGGGGGSYSDYEVVCEGQGVEGTDYYGKTDNYFPLLVFIRPGEGEDYIRRPTSRIEGFPDEWGPESPRRTQLVACLTVLDRDPVMECQYGEEGSDEVQVTITYYDARYRAVLYDAGTGEEYDSTEFEVKMGEECPDFVYDSESMEDLREVNADPGPGLIPFLEPWAQE
jgi:hypothetical protein